MVVEVVVADARVGVVVITVAVEVEVETPLANLPGRTNISSKAQRLLTLPSGLANYPLPIPGLPSGPSSSISGLPTRALPYRSSPTYVV